MVETTNKGGAPIGNTNAAKGNRWRLAIEKALNKRSKAEGQQELVRIAEKLLDKALDGDIQALKELGDRIDGKPAQSITLGEDQDNPFGEVARRIVK